MILAILIIQFVTFNILASWELINIILPWHFVRHGVIGLVASIVSDTFVNALRVVKITKQTLGSKHAVSNYEAVQMILAADGWRGLLGRGLLTRILANALQSILFTIVWRGLAER